MAGGCSNQLIEVIPAIGAWTLSDDANGLVTPMLLDFTAGQLTTEQVSGNCCRRVTKASLASARRALDLPRETQQVMEWTSFWSHSLPCGREQRPPPSTRLWPLLSPVSAPLVYPGGTGVLRLIGISFRGTKGCAFPSGSGKERVARSPMEKRRRGQAPLRARCSTCWDTYTTKKHRNFNRILDRFP